MLLLFSPEPPLTRLSKERSRTNWRPRQVFSVSVRLWPLVTRVGWSYSALRWLPGLEPVNVPASNSAYSLGTVSSGGLSTANCAIPSPRGDITPSTTSSTTLMCTSTFRRKSRTYMSSSFCIRSMSSPALSANTKRRIRHPDQTRCFFRRQGKSSRTPPSPTIHQMSMVPRRRASNSGHSKPFVKIITFWNMAEICTMFTSLDRVSTPSRPAANAPFGQEARTQLGSKAPSPAHWTKSVRACVKSSEYTMWPKPSIIYFLKSSLISMWLSAT
mmetsp:Transcript_3196/g.7505  ORF Transcript_3196/g.7505 Transcript_3196/m.7505 type:complete len:272 (-) Transcript_3196:1898-2713(-)